jgi:hypothetical protein
MLSISQTPQNAYGLIYFNKVQKQISNIRNLGSVFFGGRSLKLERGLRDFWKRLLIFYSLILLEIATVGSLCEG